MSIFIILRVLKPIRGTKVWLPEPLIGHCSEHSNELFVAEMGREIAHEYGVEATSLHLLYHCHEHWLDVDFRISLPPVQKASIEDVNHARVCIE